MNRRIFAFCLLFFVTSGQFAQFRISVASTKARPYSTFHTHLIIQSQHASNKTRSVTERPQLVAQLGHGWHIKSISFSPDKQLLLTSSLDGTARLWSRQSGLELRCFKGSSSTGHQDDIEAAAFSQDGRNVNLILNDGTVRVQDVKRGNIVRQYRTFTTSESQNFITKQGIHMRIVVNEPAPEETAITPDGSIAVLVGRRQVERWDLTHGRRFKRFSHHLNKQIKSIALTADGRLILIAGWDDKISVLWNTTTGKEIQRFTQEKDVENVVVSFDGSLAAIADVDHSLFLREVRSGRILHEWKNLPGRIESIAFSSNCRWVLAGCLDGTAILWDCVSGKMIHTFQGMYTVNFVAFSPDKYCILAAASSIFQGNWQTGTLEESCVGMVRYASSVAISSNSKHILIGTQIWDIEMGSERQHLRGHFISWLGGQVAISPDNRYALAPDKDGKSVRLLDIVNGQEIRRFDHPDEVWKITFSSDGRHVLTGGYDQVARIWDTQTGKKIQEFKGHKNSITSSAFSPDGRYIATGSDLSHQKIASVSDSSNTEDTLRLWDIESGKQVRGFRIQYHLLPNYHESVSALAFSADGCYLLAVGSYWEATLWEVATGKVIQHYICKNGDRGATSISFSPDGEYVVAGQTNGSIFVWERATGKEISKLTGHLYSVTSLSFSQDARYLVSGSSDGTARIWNGDPAGNYVVC